MKGTEMKKWFMLMLCLTFFTSVQGNEPNVPEKTNAITGWLNIGNLGQDETDLGAWVGFRKKATDNLDAEVGFATNYHEWVTEDNGKDYSYALGVYGVLHIKEIIDVNMPKGFEGFPEKLMGEPFVSIEYLKDMTDPGQNIGIGAGARLFDLFAFKTQYNFVQGIPVDNHLVLSLSLRFKF